MKKLTADNIGGETFLYKLLLEDVKDIDHFKAVFDGIVEGISRSATSARIVGDTDTRAVNKQSVSVVHTGACIMLGGVSYAIAVLENVIVGPSAVKAPFFGLIVAGETQLKLNIGVLFAQSDNAQGGEGVEAQGASRAKYARPL